MESTPTTEAKNPVTESTDAPEKWRLALWAGLGALAPDIVLLYSKRFTVPHVEFDYTVVALGTALYVGLAGLVATIFPYKILPGEKGSLLWKAFGVGVCLPILVSTLASIGYQAPEATRGTIAGALRDLIAMF